MKGQSAATTWALEVQGLTKSFGNRLVLRGVDLKVNQGESLVIFGPNGSGKTTLIKILATIMNPSTGSILVDGLSLKDRAEEIRSRIGLVTHQTLLYDNLTACENLEFYARMYDVSHRKERIEEVAAIVGVTSRLHDRVGILSRGLQQRVSIARCLLHQPSIIFLDEPETGLDQQSMAMLWKALPAEGTRTILMTTHSLERGLELADRLLILTGGRIAYECPCTTLDLAGLKTVYEQCTRVGA